MQVEKDPNFFLDEGSRVFSVCSMSATHVGDNLLTVLTKFKSVLGHSVSKEKLESRNYSCEFQTRATPVGCEPSHFDFVYVRTHLRTLLFLSYSLSLILHEEAWVSKQGVRSFAQWLRSSIHFATTR